MKKLLICFFCVLFTILIQAQEEKTLTMPRLRLGIEAGVNSLFSQINKPEMIRESRYYYYDHDYDFHCGFVYDYPNSAFYNFGLKLDYMLHKRIAMSIGLRFSFYKATLASDRDYFLWKVSETETSSNYIKINNISQTNYYLGIPLETRFFLTEKDYIVRTYFIIGTSFNFLVATDNKVAFHNPEMEKYNSNVLKHIGNPNSFYCSFYGGFGLKFGKANYPFGNVEFFFPVLNFEKDNIDAFIRSDVLGFGIRTTLHIPVIRKHILTYSVTD
ncbi:MAG: hypothetical protein FWC10_05595 [Lentimicrobiaceae bacterium]|nr:hypothetical protein [Lentimicrobiaceae bacterium]